MGISMSVLDRSIPLTSISAACKISWASARSTTRVEDSAYCLLGLLGVNMPLLYGEGEKAFLRLQEAVLSSSDDISLLAWGYGLYPYESGHMSSAEVLAPSPAAFLGHLVDEIHYVRRTPRVHTTVTGHGLHIELPMVLVDPRNRIWLGIIGEHDTYAKRESNGKAGIAIVLSQRLEQDTNIFERAGGCPPIRIGDTYQRSRFGVKPKLKMVYLQDAPRAPSIPLQSSHPALTERIFWPKQLPHFQQTCATLVAYLQLKAAGYVLFSVFPSLDRWQLPHYHDTTPLLVSFPQVKAAGYVLSSVFPPLHRGQELSSAGPGTEQDDNELDVLRCRGSQNHTFYAIFTTGSLTNGAGFTFGVRVQTDWSKEGPLADVKFCKLGQKERMGTALGLWGNDVGWGKAFRTPVQWRSHVNMWSASHTPGHLQATQYDCRSEAFAHIQCWLVWDAGHITEDAST
jgi:hypothetical protein